MESCLNAELFKFDPSKPSPSTKTIIITTLAIMICTNIVYRLSLKLFPQNIITGMGKDKQYEYDSLKERGISLNAFAVSEVINGTLYAPVAEELFFRFLLFKYFLVGKLGMDPYIANFVQALIFGSIHLTNSVYSQQLTSVSLIQSLSSTIIGLISGFAYIRTNSILPGLLAHVLNNLNSSIYEIGNYSRSF